MKGKMNDWVFGCDICQDVCPWNRRSISHKEKDFLPRDGMLEMDKRDWEEMTEEVFKKVFKDSALKRAKYKGLKRNIEFLK